MVKMKLMVVSVHVQCVCVGVCVYFDGSETACVYGCMHIGRARWRVGICV